MDISEVKKLYIDEFFTLRMIAARFNSNHHTIKRILVSCGVEITQKNRIRMPFTEDHKSKISESRKKLKECGYVPYNKGLKTHDRKCKNGVDGKELLYRNMKGHLRFDVPLQWLMKFDDFSKLKELNVAITPRSDRYKLSTNDYIAYIEKFYFDPQFNKIYQGWIESGKLRYMRPSIDHIKPKANGGDNSLNNLQFLTWFENRCKNDMSQDEWDNLKKNIGNYFI